MKTLISTAALALALVACGDDNKNPDAPRSIDSPPVDAIPIPPLPHVGAQIDRMGRPAINTALNHLLDAAGAMKTAAKDAYNQDTMVSNWPTAYTPEFAKNLAILDALDKGLLPATTGIAGAAGFVCSTTTTTPCTKDSQCPAGEHCKGPWHCSTTIATPCGRDTDCPTNQVCAGQACGNQFVYNAIPGGDRFNAMQCFMAGTYQPGCSYATLAAALADDQLYLETTKVQCNAYLAVELAAVTGTPLTNCGGRAPSNDVIDVTYSVAAAGAAGFGTTGGIPDTTKPLFGDMVPAHSDYTATFPYFGPPH